MKNNFLITLLILSTNLFAQNKFSVSPIGSLDYSIRTLSGNSYNQNTIEYRNSNELPKIGFRIGADFHYKINKKISIKTGLRFVSAGYQNKKIKNINWASEYDALTGITTIDPSLPHELQYKYKYYFIEIPLALHYHLSHKKVTYFVEAGLSSMIYTNNRIKQITDIDVNYSKETIAKYNAISLYTITALGIEYKMRKNITPFFQPTFRYGLTPINNNPIKMKLLSLGFEVGLRIAL